MIRPLTLACGVAATVLLLAGAGSTIGAHGTTAIAALDPDGVGSVAAALPRTTNVSVSLSGRKARPGDRFSLRIQVRNDGEVPATDVAVRLKSSNPRVRPVVTTFRFRRIEPQTTGVRSVVVTVDLRAKGRALLTARSSGGSDTALLRVVELGPCRNPLTARRLLCPDLRVAKPSEMYLDNRTRPGRALLRATNDIQSLGNGPMELRGRRDRPRSMVVMQAIARRGGGYSLFPVQARLRFHDVGSRYGGSFWKVRSPLRFELWRLDRQGKPGKRVRVGPKQFYCFRDLVRTRPGPRSPASEVYPACNQNPRQREVTLGTSVGWSDIYPSTYDEQWIDVTGLRGCFAYLMRVDPLGLLYETREGNNTSLRKLRLPYRGGGAKGC